MTDRIHRADITIESGREIHLFKDAICLLTRRSPISEDRPLSEMRIISPGATCLT